MSYFDRMGAYFKELATPAPQPRPFDIAKFTPKKRRRMGRGQDALAKPNAAEHDSGD